jgi:hypothetical protein
MFGTTSITHYEYLHAKEKNLEIMAFLLDERCAWPPHLVDGFTAPNLDAPKDNAAIRALRNRLQLEHIVSFFDSPSDLEARVGAAHDASATSADRRSGAGVGRGSAAFVGLSRRFRAVVSKTAAPAAANADPALPDRINVVDKSALNAQLAQSYVTELMDRARIK